MTHGANAPGTDLTRGLGRDAAWVYAHSVVGGAVQLLLVALGLRLLGTEAYGKYLVIAAIIAFARQLDLGLSAVVTNSAARASDDASARARVLTAHATNVGIASAAAVLALAVITGLAAAGELDAELAWTALTLAGSAAFTMGTNTLPAVLRGLQAFRRLGHAGIAGSLANALVVYGLLRPLGLVALGLGALAGAIVERLLHLRGARVLAPWFALMPRRPGRPALKDVLTLSWPLLAMGIAYQVVVSTDTLLLGLLIGSAAVGLYEAGSVGPTRASQLLHQGVGVLFPALSRELDPSSQREATWFVTRVSLYVGGAGYVSLAIHAPAMVRLVLGHPDPTAVAVARTFCFIWLANQVVQPAALLIVARQQQIRLLPLVAFEAIANLGLTVYLIGEVGLLGAALATLATLGISNLVLLPIIARRDLELSMQDVRRSVLAPVAIGALWAGLGAVLGTTLNGPVMAAALAVTIAMLGTTATLWAFASPGDRDRLSGAFKVRQHG